MIFFSVGKIFDFFLYIKCRIFQVTLPSNIIHLYGDEMFYFTFIRLLQKLYVYYVCSINLVQRKLNLSFFLFCTKCNKFNYHTHYDQINYLLLVAMCRQQIRVNLHFSITFFLLSFPTYHSNFRILITIDVYVYLHLVFISNGSLYKYLWFI